MANNLTFDQVSTLLNTVQSMVTGNSAIGNITTTNFVSVAQTLLKTGYDPVIQAISNLVARTIFSVRPYNKKFISLEASMETWGAHVRKISYADHQAVNDDLWTYPMLWKADGVVDASPNRYYQGSTANPSGNGESLDQYIIRKPSVLQTNFYGGNTFSDFYTVLEKQLFEVALRSPDEFGQFWSSYVLNINNIHIQWDEDFARILLSNAIASLVDEANPTRVIHLLTEYEAVTGITLTQQTVYAPDNFRPFILWLNSRIDEITRMMSERSNLYQTNVTGKTVNRFTPMSDMRVYLLSKFLSMIKSMVYTTTYHQNYLQFSSLESVNFWQAITDVAKVQITPVYTDSTGSLKTGAAVTQDNVVGIIFDREFLGYANTYSRMWATPFNARGGYYNNWLHKVLKCYLDTTEKAVVLLLD